MPITHVFHFADIHIRNGDIDRARYEEYIDVFAEACKMMRKHKAVKQKTAAIVIAGDIFHQKGRIDTPALKLFFEWMEKLLVMAPVFIICGNHDFRQEDVRQPDMIETVIFPYILEHTRETHYPLQYFKDTGTYEYENIGFGVVSVKDTLRLGNTSGIVDVLPEFPSITEFSPNVVRKYALFHGTVQQSTLQNDQRAMRSGYPLDWFKGYDGVLLGDNHKQQLHQTTEGMWWGYPGSLIQQDFGEPLQGHGFIVWNVEENSATALHVPNRRGFITFKWDAEDEMYMYHERRSIKKHLDDVILPDCPRIRLVGGPGMSAIPQHIRERAEYINLVQTVMTDIDEYKDEKVQTLSDLNDPIEWKEYLQQLNKDLRVSWISCPEETMIDITEEDKELLPCDIAEKINTRNVRIQKAIQEYRDELHVRNHQFHIKLKHMTWDYAMCYGMQNHFDFSNIEGTIALLNGPNASGKSSFLDVLCIGLYGEPTKHRNMLSGRKMTAKMIHDHRPAHKNVMRVNILFEMQGALYEIHRSYTTQKKEDHGTYAQLYSSHVARVDCEKQTRVIQFEGATAVDAWVERHFGKLEDMLMSTIMCQTDMTNFFYMKQEDQKRILDYALQLGSIAAFGKVLKEAILAHTDVINTVKTSIQGMETAVSAPLTTVSESGIEQCKLEVEKMKVVLHEMQGKSDRMLVKVGDITDIDDADKNTSRTVLEKQLQKILCKLEDYKNVDETDIQIGHRERLRELQSLTAMMETYKVPDLTFEDIQRQKTTYISERERHMLSKPTPQVARARLEKLKKDILEWERHQRHSWVKDPDGLVEEMAMWKDELANIMEDESYLQENIVSKPASTRPLDGVNLDGKYTLKTARLRLRDIERRIQCLSENKYTITRPEQDYEAWQVEWKEWTRISSEAEELVPSNEIEELIREQDTVIQKVKQRMEQKSSILRDVAAAKKEIDEIAVLPFNPDCWACNKQPYVQRKETLCKQYSKWNTLLMKLEKYFESMASIDELEDEKKSFQEDLSKRLYYEKFQERMQQEYSAWEESRKGWEVERANEHERKVLDKESSQLRMYIVQQEWKKYDKWCNVWKECQARKSELQNNISDAERFIKEWEGYQENRHMVVEEEQKWDELERWNTDDEKLKENERTLKDAELYYECKFAIEQKQKELTECGADVMRVHEKVELTSKVRHLERLMSYCDWIECKNALNEYIVVLDKKKQELQLQEHQWNQNRKLVWRVQRMNDLVHTLTTRKEQLQNLESSFIGDKQNSDGYKEWIYREKVVSLLESEVNKFLMHIEQFRLRIHYDRKCFMYYLEDRGNMPTLDKASGYQNFVVGIAMRLALSRIGAVGQNVRHLFIDEGFTACDMANIEKVPALLRAIIVYGGYESILLISHLDHVREAAAIRVHIKREGMYSTIQFGKQYPSFDTTSSTVKDVTKRKGRPKKNTD